MWLVWLAAALVAGVLEVASLDFVLLMFAGGALGASASAALGAPLPLQVVLFAVVSALLLFVGRPPLLSWSRRSQLTATNVHALIGRQAEVLREVTSTDGRVRLNGEEWSARTDHQVEVLPVGARVHVLRIDGATAVVTAEPPAIAGGEDPGAAPEPPAGR